MKIIKLSDTHYIVVDDSEIKEGDWVFNYFENSVKQYGKFFADDWLKITHSTQPLEYTTEDHLHYYKIKPLSLSDVEEAIYEYSVEKMGEDATNLRILKHKTPSQIARQYFDGYVEGFNAHKELVKDMVPLSKVLEILDLHTDAAPISYLKKELEKSLLPKTEWECTIDEQGKIKLL